MVAGLLALSVVHISLQAQTNAPSRSSDRYLFIVDTSAAMRRNAAAIEKAVGKLLLSSMQGQLQRGDTVGLWTYNEQLYAGRLPLQRWTPEGDQVIATNVLAFLKQQPFEKKPRFGAILPTLQRVVRESERITVLLLTSGEERIVGTPFDSQINQFFQKHFKAQQKARAPFVIVMRARRGGFTGATLNLAQWPVEFSPFPPEPKPAEEAKPKPPPPKPAPPTPTAPPLIIIGKKAEAETTNTTTSTDSSVTATNLSAQAKSETPPVAPASAASPAEATPTAAAITPPKPEASVAASSQATTPTVESKPPTTESPKPNAPKPEAAPGPAPETSAAPTATQTASATASPPAAVEAKSQPSPGVEPPAQVATATAPERPFKLAIVLTILTALLVLAVIGYFLNQRRARTHASLITRSMDQERK